MKSFQKSPGFVVLATLLLLCGFQQIAAAADYVVIVNKDNPAVVDKSLIGKIYSGEVRTWKDGSPITPVDLPEDSPVRANFSNDALGKSVANVKALWAQLVFAGRALPPKQAATDEEVKKLVAANKSAIGYVKATSLDDSVRSVTQSSAVIYVICGPAVSLSASDVRDVFLGEKEFAGSTKLAPADNTAAQAAFLSKALQMDAAKYSAIWTKKSFRDNATPPAVKNSDADTLDYVKHTAGACGYVTTEPGAGALVVAKF